MSVCEGLALSRLAKIAPAGTCVECGTHSGKSAVAIASGLKHTLLLHLIDPDFKATWSAINGLVGRACDFNLSANQIPASSTDALSVLFSEYGDFAFVFLDSGDHTYELCRAECNIVAPRMVKGGIIAFHDYNSQFTGVEKCYNELLETGEFKEIVIPWKDIEAKVIADKLEEGNVTYHHPELANPMFLGALLKL